jgi:hypothetical protein
MGGNNIAAGGKVAPALRVGFPGVDQVWVFHVILVSFPTVKGKTDRVWWGWKALPLN